MSSFLNRTWLLIFIAIIVSAVLYSRRETQTYRTRADQNHPVSSQCKIVDGENRTSVPDGTLLVTCKKGIPEGPEILLNPEGATVSYSINHNGKSEQHYFQMPEQDLTKQLTPESQKELCANIDKHTKKRFSYTCENERIHGTFIEFDTDGSPFQKIQVKNGQLNGIYEEFMHGRLLRKLEFKNGVLDGNVIEFDESGIQLYDGAYKNGRQEGVFHFQPTTKSPRRTIEFHDGIVTSIR